MKRCISSSAAVRFSVLSVTLALLMGSAVAQDAAKGKAAAKAKPRLPAHFAKVVDPEQREKILEIRAGFAEKKEALQKQLDAIAEEEMTAIEAVLSPEQKQKLAAIQAEAKAAREKKAGDKKAEAKKAGGEKPAAKAAK